VRSNVRAPSKILLGVVALASVTPPSPARAAGEARSFVPTGYACVWHDEFGGEPGRGEPRARLDEASWTFQELEVNGEAQVYTTKQCAARDDWNVCVEDGRLRVRARAEAVDCARDGVCAPHFGQRFHAKASYTSGRIMSKHKVHFHDGYLELRAKLPDAERAGPPQSGLWPAVWMLGDDIAEGPPPGEVKWPACGEIDVMEWASQGGVSRQGWNALWLGPGGTNACSRWPQGGNAACGPCVGGSGACVGAVAVGDRFQMRGWPDFDHHPWHTYGLEWVNGGDDATDHMTYFIDGVKMGVLKLGPEQAAFKRDMFLTINLALGGQLGGPIEITDWEHATLDVDYVRWYRRGQRDACGGPAKDGAP
jgi:beta-glucanase (GH16 family)